jgi:hypothetical protein
MTTTSLTPMVRLISLGMTIALLTGCASSLQGSVGPLASPKAAQMIDLVDEMFTRADRVRQSAKLSPQIKPPEQCYGENGKTATDRSLELTTKSNLTDEKLTESRLWRSSNIPGSATQEIMCLTRAQSALEDALNNLNKLEPKAAQQERNHLQDRLLAASEQSCSNYKRYLNAVQSSTNFGLGASALVLAAVATNVASPLAAKNYTTGALISSGMATQYNADMFSSQLVFVITKAIDAERQEALARLQQDRKKKELSEYSLSAALSDALLYHDLCSLPAGLAKLDLNTTMAKDPGLKHLQNMFPEGSRLEIKNGVMTATVPAATPPSKTE